MLVCFGLIGWCINHVFVFRSQRNLALWSYIPYIKHSKTSGPKEHLTSEILLWDIKATPTSVHSQKYCWPWFLLQHQSYLDQTAVEQNMMPVCSHKCNKTKREGGGWWEFWFHPQNTSDHKDHGCMGPQVGGHYNNGISPEFTFCFWHKAISVETHNGSGFRMSKTKETKAEHRCAYKSMRRPTARFVRPYLQRRKMSHWQTLECVRPAKQAEVLRSLLNKQSDAWIQLCMDLGLRTHEFYTKCTWHILAQVLVYQQPVTCVCWTIHQNGVQNSHSVEFMSMQCDSKWSGKTGFSKARQI